MGKRFLWLLVGLMSGWSLQANAQSAHLTAKSLALGGGGTAYVEGYHANFINPANLMLGGAGPRITFGLLGGISTSMGGPLINLHVYDTYFTRGLTITGSIAEDALTDWFGNDPAGMKNFGMQVDFIPVGLSVRNDKWAMGLALRTRILMNTGINKGAAQLAIYGFNAGIFGDGQPVNFSTSTLVFYEASLGVSIQLLEIENLGFARNVKIYAGAAPKLLLGVNSYKADFNSVLTLKGPQNEVEEIRHDFNYRIETTGEITDQLTEYYQVRESQSKVPVIEDYVEIVPEDMYGVKTSGWGLDLGAVVEMDVNIPVLGALFKGAEHLQVGLSLTDLGSLTFTENAGAFVADKNLIWRGFNFDQETIDEEYNGDRGEYISHVLEDSIMTGIYNSFVPQKNVENKRFLPTMLHFGTRLILSKLSISVDLTRGFSNEGVNTQKMALSTGIEYDLFGFFPLRVGMRTGGYSSTSYSAGVGLEFRNFEFSIAASTVNTLAKNGSAGMAWSGLILKF
ncbi:MAG TPA: DUF5723 family protein [Balneolaceae bacterium]